MKLPLIACVLLSAAGCAPLGQYAAMTGQPSAGAARAPSPASAAPASLPGAAPESSATSASPSAPSTVSVTIKSSCGETVKVFFGEKPKFGSGTYSSASSNSRSNHSFHPGDQFWIVDDSQNGVASVAVTESTREIEILGSCDRLAAR